MTSDSQVRLGDAVSVIMEKIMPSVLGKFEVKRRQRPPKKERLLKRDAVIFAAILLGLEGLRYSLFLREREIEAEVARCSFQFRELSQELQGWGPVAKEGPG